MDCVLLLVCLLLPLPRRSHLSIFTRMLMTPEGVTSQSCSEIAVLGSWDEQDERWRGDGSPSRSHRALH